MASDEEIAAQKEKLDDLRQKIAQAKQANLDKVREAQNDTVMASLKAEEERLQAELTEVEGTRSTDEKPSAAPDEAPKDSAEGE